MGFNEYKVLGKITKIYIPDKKSGETLETTIDTDDLERLINADLSWRKHVVSLKNDSNCYVTATKYCGIIDGKPSNKTHVLHRFILGETDSSILIDHIDNNYLNNQKENLRKTNMGENLKNRKSANSNNTSGYRNVTRIGNYWRVQIQINKKNCLFPNKFENVDEAGAFAKEMRKVYYGEFAGNG